MLFLTSCYCFEDKNCGFVKKNQQYADIVSLNYWVSQKTTDFSQRFNDTIRKRILSLLDSPSDTIDIDKAMDLFLEKYRSCQTRVRIHLRDSILWKNDTLLSLASYTYACWGDTQGYDNVTFLNFKPSGECYTNQEILDNQEIRTKVEFYFRKKQNISGRSINENGFWFEDDVFVLPENVGFTKDSLIFHYNPYQIAPYNEGGITIKIPIREINKK